MIAAPMSRLKRFTLIAQPSLAGYEALMLRVIPPAEAVRAGDGVRYEKLGCTR